LQVEREGQSEEAHIEHEQLREEAEETRYQNGAKPQSSWRIAESERRIVADFEESDRENHAWSIALKPNTQWCITLYTGDNGGASLATLYGAKDDTFLGIKRPWMSLEGFQGSNANLGRIRCCSL